ncbi:MAG: hypothetical protein ACOC2R_01705 [Spirochaetota bacterium]
MAVCILTVSWFVTGCASTPPTSNDTARPSSTAEAEQHTADKETAAEETESEAAEDSPETASEPVDTEGTEAYEMGEEEYQETKNDLSKLVEELNQIIASRSYQEWLTYLTSDYKEHYSNPEVLQDYSDTPLLNKYDIKLRSLKDYFNYVVVASRKDVRIDDIKALSENKVRAYMVVNNKPIVVYTLEKVDGQWKITK